MLAMKRSFPSCSTVATTVVGTILLYFLIYPDFLMKAIPPTVSSPPAQLPSQIEVPKCEEKITLINAARFAQFPESMKDYIRYRHCKSFRRTLDNPDKCGGSMASGNVFLLLVIKSAPKNFVRREIIRKTWGAEAKYQGVQVKRLFIVGVSSDKKERKKMNDLLKIENDEYRDILQWDFFDSFYNLTLKQVLFLEWLEGNCPRAQFVFNGDDDVFVHTYNVVRYLLGVKESKSLDRHLFVGMLHIGMPLVRFTWSKYYVPEELFPNNTYVPYCAGGGILMSGSTARAIFQASLDIEQIPIDDAYFGMCLQKAGLKPGSHLGIRSFGIKLPDTFDTCFYQDQLVVHDFTPYKIMILWKAIQQPNHKCWKKPKFFPV